MCVDGGRLRVSILHLADALPVLLLLQLFKCSSDTLTLQLCWTRERERECKPVRSCVCYGSLCAHANVPV